MKSADVMVDEMGFNSVFMDGYGLCYGAEFAYNQWDGHTADIDPITKKIIRTKGSVIPVSYTHLFQMTKQQLFSYLFGNLKKRILLTVSVLTMVSSKHQAETIHLQLQL